MALGGIAGAIIMDARKGRATLPAESRGPHPTNHRNMLVAGNWKSNKSFNEAREFAHAFSQLSGAPEGVEVMIAPPAPYLAAMGRPAVRCGRRSHPAHRNQPTSLQ